MSNELCEACSQFLAVSDGLCRQCKHAKKSKSAAWYETGKDWDDLEADGFPEDPRD